MHCEEMVEQDKRNEIQFNNKLKLLEKFGSMVKESVDLEKNQEEVPMQRKISVFLQNEEGEEEVGDNNDGQITRSMIFNKNKKTMTNDSIRKSTNMSQKLPSRVSLTSNYRKQLQSSVKLPLEGDMKADAIKEIEVDNLEDYQSPFVPKSTTNKDIKWEKKQIVLHEMGREIIEEANESPNKKALDSPYEGRDSLVTEEIGTSGKMIESRDFNNFFSKFNKNLEDVKTDLREIKEVDEKKERKESKAFENVDKQAIDDEIDKIEEIEENIIAKKNDLFEIEEDILKEEMVSIYKETETDHRMEVDDSQAGTKGNFNLFEINSRIISDSLAISDLEETTMNIDVSDLPKDKQEEIKAKEKELLSKLQAIPFPEEKQSELGRLEQTVDSISSPKEYAEKKEIILKSYELLGN